MATEGNRRFSLGSVRRILPLLLVCAALTFAGAPSPLTASRQRATVVPADPLNDNLQRAKDLIARGQYDEATALLDQPAAANPAGESALELGLLELMRGRRAQGTARLQRILDAASSFGLAGELLRAGLAARALGEFREANGFFREAASRGPENPAIHTAWGDLFLEKYNKNEASRSYQAALQVNHRWAPAHVGLAKTIADENPPGAAVMAQRALSFDPNYAPAYMLLAELALDEGRADTAREMLEKVLSQNPNSLDARSLVAAMAHLDGRTADFDAEVARVLKINPTYGEVYRVAGDLAARNYRFPEAVVLVKRGLALDPQNVRASADLGIHLLRTGDEEEARTVLDRAFEADPYDVVTYNLLGLFDSLEKFETITEGDIVLRLHPDEAAVLKEYALPLAQEALRTLSTRYEFTPRGPILIEVFPRHDDFAVRNVGLPGMIGALGACFGRVVTMDSPRARPPGTFDWRATLWHELAHVITLQMSNQRVPRWLTEGISGYEEKRAQAVWGRDMEVEFAQALERGDALRLKDLNAGFQRPQTIGMAYFQAALLVEYLVDTHGEPNLYKLVRSFADGRDTDKAVRDVYGSDLEGLQAGFDAMVDKRFGAIRRALVPPTDTSSARDIEGLRRLSQSNPNSYPVHLAIGQTLRASGDLEGAAQALERATELVPMAKGPESARLVLIEVLTQKGDRSGAIRHLEALLSYDHSDIQAARRLAELATAAGDEPRLWLAYERISGLDPFDAAAHAALGRMAIKKKDATTAIREFRAGLATGPVDVAAAHCDLGESYLLAGRTPDAKREAMAALEIAPNYVRAQELLLKTVDVRH